MGDEHLFSCLEHESRDKLTGSNNVRSWHSLREQIHQEKAKVTDSQRRIRKHKSELDFIGDVMRRRVARKQEAAAQTKRDAAARKGTDTAYFTQEWDHGGKQHICDHTRKGGPFGHSMVISHDIPFTKPMSYEMKGVGDVDKQLFKAEWELRTPNKTTEISKYINIVLQSKVNPFPKHI
jgi:hypothetical protein